MYVWKDVCSGLKVLNACPHGLNLIKEDAVSQNPRSGKYELLEKYCQNLAGATFCYVPRSAFVLSVNVTMPMAWQSGISEDGISYYDSDVETMDFNRDIPREDGDSADVIVVSERCASLLRSKILCYQAGIYNRSSVVSKLNLFRRTMNINVDRPNWLEAMIFIDKFYIPKYQVFRGKNVVGTLGLQRFIPPLDVDVFRNFIMMFGITKFDASPVSAVGFNLAVRTLYKEARLDPKLQPKYNDLIESLPGYGISPYNFDPPFSIADVCSNLMRPF